jgi:hypothetical protein
MLHLNFVQQLLDLNQFKIVETTDLQYVLIYFTKVFLSHTRIKAMFCNSLPDCYT